MQAPQQIEHDLLPHFPDLRQFHSTKSLEQSQLYRALKPQVLKVLNSFEIDSFAPPDPAPEPFYRAVAWNIERGIHFDGIVRLLKEHPLLSTADLYLLTETDLGMARSGNRNVARDLAQALGMNYLFAPSYLNLSKGCGIEQEFEGDNTLAIHGNAILSRYPIHRPRIVPLPNAHDKMKGREKRIGCQRAVIGTVELPGGSVRAACVHIDVRSTQRHRKEQMKAVVDVFRGEGDPASLIGGDWNTSTYDSHSALSAIIGFWVRVFMGTGHVMKNHYLRPDNHFEKELFRMIEENGFDYKGCNEPSVGTNHYSVEDIKAYKNLREWIPNWCFYFIEWALRPHGGRCSFKLDWFAQKRLKILGPNRAESPRKGRSLAPQVVGNLQKNGHPVSDHDAILLDFIIN